MGNQIQTLEVTGAAHWKPGDRVFEQETHEQAGHPLGEIVEDNLPDKQRGQVLIRDDQLGTVLRGVHLALRQAFLQHKLTRNAGLASSLQWPHPTLPNKVPQPG